jgi:hypothetical protein
MIAVAASPTLRRATEVHGHDAPSFLAEYGTEHEGARKANHKNTSSDQKESRE